MAVRRLTNEKFIHLMYDTEYSLNAESTAHLLDLRDPFKELGYTVREYFIDPETVREKTSQIPRDDPNHIVFLHVDMPKGVAPGTEIETVRYVEANFKYVVGFGSKYCENCVWKSSMNKLFKRYNVPHVPSLRVAYVDQLHEEHTHAKIKALGAVYFIKVDDGYNSLGLSNACVLHNVSDVIAKAEEMILAYGPVMIQLFISGREYTIAVTNKTAYWPVERLFEKNQLVSGANGTASERLLDADTESDKIQLIQDAAMAAYQAVGGTAYGRVDLREDPLTGEVFVLEVNNTCSMSPNSYFEISVERCGTSKKKILRDILRQIPSRSNGGAY